MAYREGAAPSRVFYGWWVAAAFSLIIFLSTGARFAVGPFPKPVVSDLGLDRGSFSLVISLFLLIHQMGAALCAWLGGFLFDLSGGYGLTFGMSCALLLVGAGLSLTIDVAVRPAMRRELQPVAGGR